MKTRSINILAIFLAVALFENIAFPIAANHGRFDPNNKSMQPYLLLACFALIGIILLVIINYKKPLPNTGWYTVAKVLFPLSTILLIVNLTGLIPMNFTITSTLIFLFHVAGILIAAWLSVTFFLNKALVK